MRPGWLPSELQLNGMSLESDLEKLFSVYSRDFIYGQPLSVGGLEVYTNTSRDRSWNDQRFTYGFTHMITRGKGERLIDYARAKKLPWVRAVLENYQEPEVSVFWIPHPVDGKRLILWLEDYDFVVILSQKKRPDTDSEDGAVIITAYKVDSQYRRRFAKLREKRLP